MVFEALERYSGEKRAFKVRKKTRETEQLILRVFSEKEDFTEIDDFHHGCIPDSVYHPLMRMRKPSSVVTYSAWQCEINNCPCLIKTSIKVLPRNAIILNLAGTHLIAGKRQRTQTEFGTFQKETFKFLLLM